MPPQNGNFQMVQHFGLRVGDFVGIQGGFSTDCHQLKCKCVCVCVWVWVCGCVGVCVCVQAPSYHEFDIGQGNKRQGDQSCKPQGGKSKTASVSTEPPCINRLMPKHRLQQNSLEISHSSFAWNRRGHNGETFNRRNHPQPPTPSSTPPP